MEQNPTSESKLNDAEFRTFQITPTLWQPASKWWQAVWWSSHTHGWPGNGSLVVGFLDFSDCCSEAVHPTHPTHAPSHLGPPPCRVKTCQNRGHEWPKLGFEMSCLKIEQLYFQPEAECPQELYMCGLVFRISTAELKSVDPTVCKLIQHKSFEVRHQDT